MLKKIKTVDILKELPSIFTYADAAKFSNNPNVFLVRASYCGYVKKIARGVYFNSLFGDKPRVEQIACFIRQPSYVSCEWALNYHGVILQVPVVCTVITLSASVGKRNVIKYDDNIIEYSKISEHLFWGFERIDDFNIATPEKAFMDTVYLRKRMPFFDEIEIEKLDFKKLLKISKKYPLSSQKIVNLLLDKI